MSKKVYTQTELKTLSRLYGKMTLLEVAKKMGRTHSSIFWQIHCLGLTKTYRQTTPMKKMNLPHCDLAYIAGLVDGEGTITIRNTCGSWRAKQKWMASISVANTNSELMDWLNGKLGGPSARVETIPHKGNRVVSYQFKMLGLGFLPLYKKLLPYLIIKRERAKLAIQWMEMRLDQPYHSLPTPAMMEMIRQIRCLNIKPSSKLNVSLSKI